jgi:hypothetical protein
MSLISSSFHALAKHSVASLRSWTRASSAAISVCLANGVLVLTLFSLT